MDWDANAASAVIMDSSDDGNVPLPLVSGGLGIEAKERPVTRPKRGFQWAMPGKPLSAPSCEMPLKRVGDQSAGTRLE